MTKNSGSGLSFSSLKDKCQNFLTPTTVKVNIILKKYESHECHGWARPMIAAYLYEDRNKLSKLMIQFSLDEDEFLEYLSETTANEIDDLKLFLANEKVKMIDNKLTGAYQNY